MRRRFFLLAAPALIIPGRAFGQGMLVSPCGSSFCRNHTLATSPAGDANVSAWSAAVVAAGGTVSPTQSARIATLVGSLKGTGVWPLLDFALPLASENTQQSYLDLKSLLVTTPVGANTFTASQGVVSGVTGIYLNTNFNPTTKLVAGSLNNFHASLYGRTNRTTGNNNSCSMGVCAAGFTNTIAFTLQPGTSPQAALFANQTTGNNVSTTPGTSQGYWIMGRTGSLGANVFGMRNGSALSFSATNPSNALANANVFIGNLSNNGAPNGSNGVADQHSFATIGAGLTTQNQTDLTNAVNAYMTSLGTNVF